MRILATLLIAGICANPSLADEVFRWTDDEGVVHFSQWAPKHTSGVTTLNTASSNAADYDPESAKENPLSLFRHEDDTC